MPLTIPRRITFVAKAEYFTRPGFKGWLQRRSSRGAGQVPIDRSSGSAAAGAIRTGLKILEAGELFGIYPEGTRSPRRPALPRPHRSRADGARGQGARDPGRDDRHRHRGTAGQDLREYTRPVVRFGKPLDFSRYEGMEDDRFVLRSITDEIMYEIMALSGQEYVDMYATKGEGGGTGGGKGCGGRRPRGSQGAQRREV